MSLFDSIGVPKWQHKSPEVRKQAIGELDDEAVLLQLVRTDSDASVQEAALQRINAPATLDELVESLESPLKDQARARRLLQLLPNNEALASINDDALLVRIANLSDQMEVICAAIDRLSSEEVRVEVACQHAMAKVRLHAAQGIRNLAALDNLMQKTRGHDKAVYRHCKNFVDEAHAQAKHAAERQEKIGQLSARMAELAGAVDSPSYEGLYRSLVQQWQVVESSASAEQKAAFQTDQAICGQRLILRAETRAEAEQNEAAIAAAQEQFPAILLALAELDATPAPQDAKAVEQIGTALDELEDRWRTAQGISVAPAGLTKDFAQKLQSWRKLLSTSKRLFEMDARLSAHVQLAEAVDTKDWNALQKQVGTIARFLKDLPWPDSPGIQQPELLVRLQQCLTTLQAQMAALDAEQKKTAVRVQAITESLVKELDAQRHREADRALGKVRKLLKSLAPSQKHHFEQVLAPLDARLKEFHDWQNFAVEPKKEDLCVRMSALIGNVQDVELLALQIQTLQTEWKALGPLPQAREKSLWTKFKSAADEAWKPCKAAFAAEADLRRKNFSQRMDLVRQLTEYEAKMWPAASSPDAPDEASRNKSDPDWSKVQSTLDTARATFRASSPVDQKGERTSQKAFRQICDRIYAHLHDEYQRNMTLKQDLVTRAGELAGRPELQRIVDEVKKLQAEWKAVGITPIGPDRKLWKEFRSACDQVFVRLDQQREKQKSETSSQVQQAESIRDQARALLQTSDPTSTGALLKSISELKAAALANELPPPVQQRLTKDFQGIERQARDLAATLKKRQEQDSWTRLEDAVKACASISGAERAGAAPWQSAGDLPKGVDSALLQAFWAQGPDEKADDVFRDACIALEVFGEIESPPQDKQARMSYQLRRLTQGLGNRTQEAGNTVMHHINAFTALRPTSPWVERFYAGVKSIRR